MIHRFCPRAAQRSRRLRPHSEALRRRHVYFQSLRSRRLNNHPPGAMPVPRHRPLNF